MTLPTEIEDINEKLKGRFGLKDDKPRFQLVWSENEQEYRPVEFTRGMKLLYPEMMYVRKYSYIKDRYVLEKWRDGSYEPIWVFEDKNHEFLMPIWRATEIIALASDDVIVKNFGDYLSEDDKAMEKEVEYFEDMLEDGNPYGNQETNFVKPVYLSGVKRHE